MAQTVRVVVHDAGVDALLHDSAVQADLTARAERIADRAGAGFIAEASPEGSRARAVVVATTYDAMRAEATERALTRAIDAGR